MAEPGTPSVCGCEWVWIFVCVCVWWMGVCICGSVCVYKGMTDLANLDVIGMLEGDAQLLPGGCQGFAVPTPGGKELHKVGTCR